MESQLLRTFVAVADQGSFSAAATQLGYTQSAVSQQIAVLETDLGAKLLHRRPVSLTEAGERLLEHARPLLLRIDAARAEVARVAGSPPALVSVGTTPLAAPRAAAALARARRSHPRADITVRVVGRGQVLAQVAAGILDLGLEDGIAAPNDPLRFPDIGPASAVRIAEEELAAVLPARHPLAQRSALRLTDLADARWLDAPDTGMPLPDLRAAAGSDGFRPSLSYHGTDLATLLALAAAGHGLTVLPSRILAGVPGVTGVSLTADPPLVHRTELVHG
ncbi:MAG TPA: LysR family transcriptional regulator, partial [Streptosporangiaceae bacterium]